MITTTTPTEELEFLGSRARVLADAATADGGFGLVEFLEMPAGDMPPLHVHRSTGESFYVLEGEISFFLPDTQVILRRGDFFYAPPGVPHTYRVGDGPARALVLSTPSGFEAFVRAVSALPQVDPETLTRTAAAHEIDILGPPGTLPS
jgi:mannose-6-phosphate isomerase-like protein (cupin superfamily)